VGNHVVGGGVDHFEGLAGLTLHVAAVDKQGMASTQKRFDLGQQGDVGHGVFLVVNKRKP